MFEDLFRLDGKVAVVTGAGNGLGRSFALGLSAFGATVICADRNVESADETASLAKQSRGFAEAAHVDVADEASVDDMWKTVADNHSRIDILVNNAGIATNPVRTHEYSVADWDRLMAINLRGVFLMTRKGLVLMLPGPGSIINISSVAGLRGYWPGFPSLRSAIRRRRRASTASRVRWPPNTRRKRFASTPSRPAGTAAQP
jgi:NAD(P)-dependent dehydrogenase (short-subunit alcohol dehydrogenase family)